MKRGNLFDRFRRSNEKIQRDSQIQRPAYKLGWILQPEQILVNTYEVKKMIGSPGGMGQVFEGWDINLHRKVAIKVPDLRILMAPEGAENFLHEARLAAKLAPHPHIVRIFTCMTDRNLETEFDNPTRKVRIPFIVMEFLGGGDLAVRLARGPIAFEEIKTQFKSMCEAVQAAHEYEYERDGQPQKGVIHRDLKPQNICYDHKGRLVIVDFGLARLLESPSTSGGVKGTPTHMAPEQWNTLRGIDHRTDIYALGIILFQMATGTLPFGGRSLEDYERAHVSQAPPDPRQFRPDLPPGVSQAILKSLQKAKDDRFSSAREFYEGVAQGFSSSIAIAGGQKEPADGLSVDTPEKSEFEDELLVNAGDPEECPSCKMMVQPIITSSKRYCANCGVEFSDGPGSQVESEYPQKITGQDQQPGSISIGGEHPLPAGGAAEKCPSCEMEMEPIHSGTNRYCSNCGVTLPEHSPPISSPQLEPEDDLSPENCPSCGVEIQASVFGGQRYCSNCGVTLANGQDAVSEGAGPVEVPAGEHHDLGQPSPVKEETARTCPACGGSDFVTMGSATYCNNCGTKQNG